MKFGELKVGDVFTFDRYPDTQPCTVLCTEESITFIEEGMEKSESINPSVEFDVTLCEEEKVEASNHFAFLGDKVGNLVAEKQKAYGDSFGRSGDCLRQMYPDGIKPEQYDDLLTLVRILDKLFRIASNPDAFEENPYQDICGYALLGMNRYEKEND